MNKNKNLAFTLAEVLIVIGIIGVVAALTLPNLNHATGDKETVTRLKKAHSILAEATDRAVAIYGPMSSWASNEQCASNLDSCWIKRVGEFLKISKACEYTDAEDNSYASCENFGQGILEYYYNQHKIIYQLSDGMVIAGDSTSTICDYEEYDVNDICVDEIWIDVNGPNKGKNSEEDDQFRFVISDKLGFIPYSLSNYNDCIHYKGGTECAAWVLDFGNLDYRKADNEGKCNDSDIILDGTTNTSCH